ncbi:MAG: oligosaccharide flippase family protein [Candidatus Methanofastidiosia archaeon]|jgi:O-antigen/teichoic acid export membrane protein
MEKSKALKQIAKGGSIVFVGYVLTGMFNILYKISVARFLSPTEYGLLSLGIGVVIFLTTVSRLGFFQAFQKFIPEYRTQGEHDAIKGLICFGAGLSLTVGCIFTSIIYMFSEEIALHFFNAPELIPVLKVLSFAIPALVLIFLLLSLFLSFKRPTEKVLLDAGGRGALLLALTGMAIVLGGNLLDVCYVYVFCCLISAVIGGLYFLRKIFSLKNKSVHIEYNRIISFSLPLLFVGFLMEVLHWSDTFFIGYFKGEYLVGLYNAARPLASLLLTVIFSLNSLFYPVASELHAQGKSNYLREVYLSVTRWIFVFTFPLFLFLVFFSKDLITILFGTEYAFAQNALIILSAGTFVNAFFGAVGIILQIHEKQNFIFAMHFLAAVINIIMNVILIPVYGIEGAAAATAAAIIFWNVLYFIKVNKILKVWFDLTFYAKYGISAFFALVLSYILHLLTGTGVGWLFLKFFLFFSIYFFMLLVTRSFSQEDIEILLLFEKKSGINLNRLKRILKKFMK